MKELESNIDERTLKTRDKIHAEHLDYYYGDYWCMFIDKSNKCFLEFDIGRFGAKFITCEISQEDYDSLKEDNSKFDSISRKYR